MALLSNIGCFMSVKAEDDSIVADKRTAGDGEMLWVRSNIEKEVTTTPLLPQEEQGSLAEVELNYV